MLRHPALLGRTIRTRRTARSLITASLSLALVSSGLAATTAHATTTRYRAGSSADASRTTWNGPGYVFSGAGGIVPATMGKTIDAIRGGTGTLDVTVIAASAGTTSPTPECDVITTLAGVNSCTTLVLTTANDGNNTAANADIRAAELVYFAGGNQCTYVSWKGTALQASVQSVVAKGGGVGGGSAGHHVNSSVVYDACGGSVTSTEALADPYAKSMTFTTGLFNWANYGSTINDSHFVTRDRMGRTMAFVARALKDGYVSGGKAWGVGVEEGASLFVDKKGLATLSGPDAYVVLGDHAPETVVARTPLTYTNFKIWHLTDGSTFDFANRPTCGYYLRSVVAGIPDANLYSGVPVTSCDTPPPPTSTFTEVEPNDSRSAANDITGLASPATVTGAMVASSDRDYFRTSLAQNQTLTVSCSIPNQYDADLYLLDANGSTLTRSVNDGAGVSESVSYRRTASGTATYYVDLEAYSGSGSAAWSCTLTTT